MNQLDNKKKLISSKALGGASNAMGVLQSIASLGSSINNMNSVSNSENMTGQEMAQDSARKEAGVANSAIASIMAVIGTVLACI